MKYVVWPLVVLLFFTAGGEIFAFMILLSYYALKLIEEN